jgi:hypothetical protein
MRRRVVHACDVCRLHKIRCNGGQPCPTCSSTNQECAYGTELNPKSKSDAILEGIQRMEDAIQGVRTMIQNASFQPASNSSPNGGFISSPQTYHTASIVEDHRSPARSNKNIHNAVLSPFHTSTTESVLHWPHFDVFLSLRQNYVSVFNIEQCRSPILGRPTSMFPYVGSEDLTQIILSFQYNVNFWYPTVSYAKTNDLRLIVTEGNVSNDTPSCLALMVLALGCASQSVERMYDGNKLNSIDMGYQKSRRSMAEMYFDGVLKKIHVAHMEMSTAATQSLFHVA